MKNCKSILFILPSTDFGGAEKQAIILGKALSSLESFHISFLCFNHKGGTNVIPKILSHENIDCHVIDSEYPNLHWYTKYFRLYQLFRFLFLKNYNILLPYLYEMNIGIGLIRCLLRAKICIWNQRDDGFNGNKTFFNKIASRNFNFFISNSKGGEYFLINRLSVNPEKVFVIKNGIVLPVVKIDRQTWRKINGFRDDVIICGMIANLNVSKDHLTLIKAWSIVHEYAPLARLILVGHKGNAYYDISNLITQLNLSSTILIYGPSEDIGSILNAIDISILSSFAEGTSNVLLESLLMKKPFIGTRISGFEEILGIDCTSLFTPGDYESASKLILEYINDPSLRNSKIESNYLKVVNDYSVENMLHQSLRLFNY